MSEVTVGVETVRQICKCTDEELEDLIERSGMFPARRMAQSRGGRLGQSDRELSNDNPSRLVVAALVPPRPLLDPPAVLPLVVEEHAAPTAHVVFQFGLMVLLHTHLDCVDP